MTIIWRENMATGISVIDNDHKRLIEITNQIVELLNSLPEKSFTEASAEIEQAFIFLHDYTKVHFKREEMIFRAIGHEEHKKHAVHHKDVIMKLVKSYNNFKEGAANGNLDTTADQLIKILHFWLMDHVIKEDLKAKPAAKAHLMYGIGQDQ